MKHNPHRLPDFVLRILLSVLLFLSGCVFVQSGLVQLLLNHSLCFSLLALLSLLLGLCAFSSLWFSLFNLSVCIHLDDRGMRKTRFGKTLIDLPWEKITFAGICTVHSYRGAEKRFCFSPRCLSPQEQADLSLVEDSVIYFSWFSQTEWDYIRNQIPIPLEKQKPSNRVGGADM